MFTDSREPLVEVALHVLCSTLEGSEPAVPPSEVIAGTASVKPANEVSTSFWLLMVTVMVNVNLYSAIVMKSLMHWAR